MALLHLMAEWRADGEAKPDLTVLTVDHGLRAESRDEAAMVTRVARCLWMNWYHFSVLKPLSSTSCVIPLLHGPMIP